MASAVLTEGILIIASIIVATALSGAAISKVGVFQSAFTSSTENQKQITLTKIKVIYATNSSSTKVNTWVKNIGVSPITTPDSVDVYFGKLGATQRIPYNTGTTPTWNYTSFKSVWEIKDTVQIDIFSDNNLQKNVSYMVKVTTPNGVSDEQIFSIS